MDNSDRDYRTSHLLKGSTYDQTLQVDAFDAYMSRREDDMLATLVPRLFPDGVPRYLDFACGTGRVLSRVSQFSHDAVGVDISATMLEGARAKCPSARLVQADLTKQDLDLGSFDLITTFRFLGNAQDSLRRAVLDALVRRLKPGGYLILNSHRNPQSIRNLLHRGSADGQDLHLRKLHRLLTSHGLIVQRTFGIGWWVILDAQNCREVLASRLARVLDVVPMSRPSLARFCPDAVVVGRRSIELR